MPDGKMLSEWTLDDCIRFFEDEAAFYRRASTDMDFSESTRNDYKRKLDRTTELLNSMKDGTWEKRIPK